MNPYSQFSLSIPFCNECQYCCQGIPTGVCGYHTLLEIQQGNIPPEICSRFIVYRIHKKHVDGAAFTWWHLPSTAINLITQITCSQEEFYEILAIPKTRGKCILLGSCGCAYPQAKPFNCNIFPFYLQKDDFHVASWCKYIDQLDVRDFQPQVEQITHDYQKYSLLHRTQYMMTLQKLKKKWDWTIHVYRTISS